MATKLAKRIISVFLCVIMILGNFAVIGFATDTEYTSGNYTYTVSSGKATITAYKETATGDVDIPDKLGGYIITAIDDYAFFGCTLIRSVNIPSSIKTIGNYAFAYCTYLEDVVISASVTSIGNKAFNYSTKAHISCIEDSYAMEYAKNNGVNYEILEPILSNSDVTYNYNYKDEYFLGSAYDYNHDLATMTLAFALSAFVNDGGDYSSKEPINTKKMFNVIGFRGYKPYGYDSKPQTNSIACVIGYKNIINKSGEYETVIAIAVRGGGYESEWAGNANVGLTSTHNGFNIAAKKVLSNIQDYISVYGNRFADKVKFWITGYSRGAATSNLVASALDNHGKHEEEHYINIESLNYSNDDVFVYTFETPLNTRNSDTKDDKYNNIFNIVNKIDLVTKVAPEGWGYSRYGRDCFLPSAETYDNYGGADGLKQRMSVQYKNLCGADYIEDFHFWELCFDIEWKWPPVTLAKKTDIMGQGRFLDEFFDILANDVIKNVDTYNKSYQDALMKILPQLMGVNVAGVDFTEDGFWEQVSDCLKENLLDLGKDILLSGKSDVISLTIKDAIATAAVIYFKDARLSYGEVFDALGIVDDLVKEIIKHPNYSLTLVNNAGLLFNAHYPQLCLAWMSSTTGTDVEKSNSWVMKMISGQSTYRVVKFNCPVNIKVYDHNGLLRAAIIDEIPQTISGSCIDSYIDDNGQKCFCLPNDETYKFEIVGYDNGTMSCSFSDYNFQTNENIHTYNYYDIEIKNGTKITGDIEKLSESETFSEVELKDSKGKELKVSEEVKNQKCNVIVSTNNPTCIVKGGGTFEKGEYVKASVVAEDMTKFSGWYIDGVLVSTEFDYRFRVMDNSEIKAIFLNESDPINFKLTEDLQINYKKSSKLYLDVTGYNITGYSVVFNCSNPNVATVDNNGNVYGTGKGTATITCTVTDEAGNSVSDTCKVTVNYAWWQWIIKIILFGWIWY